MSRNTADPDILAAFRGLAAPLRERSLVFRVARALDVLASGGASALLFRLHGPSLGALGADLEAVGLPAEAHEVHALDTWYSALPPHHRYSDSHLVDHATVDIDPAQSAAALARWVRTTPAAWEVVSPGDEAAGSLSKQAAQAAEHAAAGGGLPLSRIRKIVANTLTEMLGAARPVDAPARLAGRSVETLWFRSHGGERVGFCPAASWHSSGHVPGFKIWSGGQWMAAEPAQFTNTLKRHVRHRASQETVIGVLSALLAVWHPECQIDWQGSQTLLVSQRRAESWEPALRVDGVPRAMGAAQRCRDWLSPLLLWATGTVPASSAPDFVAVAGQLIARDQTGFVAWDPALVQATTALTGLPCLRSLDLQLARGVTRVRTVTALQALEVLDLRSTSITALRGLGQLKRLHTLILDDTRVESIAALKNLSRLAVLSIESTLVSDLSPIMELEAMQTLLIAGSRVVDLDPIMFLQGLQVLRVPHAVADLSPLGELLELREVDLRHSVATDFGWVAEHENLQTINACGAQIATLAPFCRLHTLRALHIGGVMDGDLSPLCSLDSLRLLRIDACDVDALAAIQEALPMCAISTAAAP